MSSIVLRPSESDDAEEFIQIVTASRESLHPWVDPPDDRVKFQRLVGKAAQPDFLSLLVCLKSDGKIIGNINLSQIVYGNFCSAYLGFWIAQPFSGRGLMAAALRELFPIAFEQLCLHRLEANVQPTNIRCRNLVARLGFRQEGYSPRYLQIDGSWKDHERWAICAEDVSGQLQNRH